MFCGKSEELIRRMRRAQIAHQNILLFKPSTDNRYRETEIVTHNDDSIPAVLINSIHEVLTNTDDVSVVGLDEIQFFDEKLPTVLRVLADKGKRVIASGLDMDFLGRPFGMMPQVLAIAEYVTKMNAICLVCGSPAHYSFRTTPDKETLMIGAKGQYEPRCRKHFLEGFSMQSKKNQVSA